MLKNHAICGSVTFLLSFEMKAQIELRLRYDHTVVNSHITIIDSLAGTEHNVAVAVMVRNFSIQKRLKV